MSYSATAYKVFIASPSDVQEEREIVREVLADWNAIHSEKTRIVLMPVGWETHSAPAFGAHPQAILNRQVLAGCDLLVGIFWTRIGTATDEYQSGTVEEIERHISSGRPAMLYFSDRSLPPQSIDHEQFSALAVFKRSCQNRSLYEAYSDFPDFKGKLYRQLEKTINSEPYFAQARPDSMESHPPAAGVVPESSGLSGEAQILLKAASQAPGGNILRLMTLSGLQIQANRKEFCGNSDPRQRAIWEGALAELEGLGFIQDRGHKKEVFGVTREGYKAADLIPF